ncbi:LicD family protein [Streptococcus suis]|nr:LicD family protein [Streptococcus suis]NQP65920.1 LicD family protein [Streptococcus suis]
MNKIQESMLQVYEQVKYICEANNLRFFAAGGTKIGAVLWNGIIPWDDDIDLVMPLEDLNQLVKILSNDTFENIGVFDGINAPYSDIVGVKVFDKRTMFTSHNLLNRPEAFTGVFVDIFPMVGSPNTNEDFVAEINTIRDELFKKRLFGDSIEENLSLVEKLKEVIVRYPFDESEIVINVANPSAESFSRKEFLDVIHMPFESTEIPVSRFYDAHLRQQYGFYTKDWPEDMRIGSHENFALVDLNHSVQFYRDSIANSPIQNYIVKMSGIKSNLESQIFAIDDRRKELEIVNEQLELKKQQLVVEIEKLELEIASTNNYVEELLTSTSWRITKPLRKFSALIKQYLKG